MVGNEVKTETPALSVLIVNHNSAGYLEACLQSIRETMGAITIEIVLVDASSSDGSVEVARQHWPAVKVVTIPESLGYVRGNNVGIKEVTGRYTMFLNSDTVMLPGAIEELVSYLDTHPEAGVISGAILNSDGSDQGVIRQFPSIMNGIFGRRSFLSRLFPNNPWYRRYMQSRRENSSEPFEAEIMSACSLVVRTELLRKFGGMDERFKFYWVDAELCVRLARKGWKVICVPRARIVHHEGKGGSTSTFAKRIKMNIAFNHDAYIAYVDYHRLGAFDPRRLFARVMLTARMVALIGAQLLRPSKATSSGGSN